MRRDKDNKRNKTGQGRHRHTIEDLARMQGVKPIKDVSALFGTWPGDINDGFEQFVQELRRNNKTQKRGNI
jgi:hypothetical protein